MDFVNEGKAEEDIKRRQAEWDRVRSAEDPVEAPPEVFDNRSLYEKLKEQHDSKKKEFEGQFALKNQVKGLDTDEVKFLQEVDEQRIKREKEIRLEEKKEVEEVKKATSSKIPTDYTPKINVTLPMHKKENKQADLLSSVIKRKSNPTASITSASTLISSTDSSFSKVTKSYSDSGSSSSDDDEEHASSRVASKRAKRDTTTKAPTQIVIGVLPGVGEYDTNSSSLSDESSDDDDDEDNSETKRLDTSGILGRTSAGGNSAASKLAKM